RLTRKEISDDEEDEPEKEDDEDNVKDKDFELDDEAISESADDEVEEYEKNLRALIKKTKKSKTGAEMIDEEQEVKENASVSSYQSGAQQQIEGEQKQESPFTLFPPKSVVIQPSYAYNQIVRDCMAEYQVIMDAVKAGTEFANYLADIEASIEPIQLASEQARQKENQLAKIDTFLYGSPELAEQQDKINETPSKTLSKDKQLPPAVNAQDIDTTNAKPYFTVQTYSLITSGAFAGPGLIQTQNISSFVQTQEIEERDLKDGDQTKGGPTQQFQTQYINKMRITSPVSLKSLQKVSMYPYNQPIAAASGETIEEEDEDYKELNK
ncbi:MAG: hypothetical protein EZS28_047324, partial [Streblomastix strix]